MILFSFCYRTTDGKAWCDTIHAPDWETALDAVRDLQGYQCGAVCAIIDHDTGETEFEQDPPACPRHLLHHPAGAMSHDAERGRG